MRQQAENLLVLDTGDALAGGDRLGDTTEGRVIVAGMNLMGYDAMAIGPQELALGLDALRQRMAEAEYPWLSANVVLADGELLARPYEIFQFGDHRVGVIGITRPPTEPDSAIQVVDPEETLARYTPEVAQQAETIVLLTNLEYQVAQALAAAVPDMDLVIAGLSEQLPSQAVRVPGTGTLLVAAEQPVLLHTGRFVGELHATVNVDGSLSGESWMAMPMTNGFADDPAMRALLEEYSQ
jgi:2',3'-cyclic-nucleotide 2'-phosphodiesterase (5'-nucleotidase family)